MELTNLIEQTPFIIEKGALTATIAYPVYSGIRAYIDKKGLLDTMVEKDTLYMVAAIAAGRMCYDYMNLLFKL